MPKRHTKLNVTNMNLDSARLSTMTRRIGDLRIPKSVRSEKCLWEENQISLKFACPVLLTESGYVLLTSDCLSLPQKGCT